MSKFNALMVTRAEDKSINRKIEKLNIDDLPAAVSYTHLTLPTILLV